MKAYFDIGNTNTKFGVYSDRMLYSFTFSSNISKSEKEVILNSFLSINSINVDDIAVCLFASVVPELNDEFIDLIKKIFKKANINCLGSDAYKYIKQDINNPKEIGQDLITDIYATNIKYNYPSIIIDLGTANKMLLVDKDGVFTSCLIVPGIDMSVYSLASQTSLLPKISLDNPTSLIESKNTVECMKNGIVFGNIDMIIGLVNRYEKEIGYQCKHIITGGATNYIRQLIPKDFIYDEYLSLDGLNYIYEREMRNKKYER